MFDEHPEKPMMGKNLKNVVRLNIFKGAHYTYKTNTLVRCNGGMVKPTGNH